MEWKKLFIKSAIGGVLGALAVIAALQTISWNIIYGALAGALIRGLIIFFTTLNEGMNTQVKKNNKTKISEYF